MNLDETRVRENDQQKYSEEFSLKVSLHFILDNIYFKRNYFNYDV